MKLSTILIIALIAIWLFVSGCALKFKGTDVDLETAPYTMYEFEGLEPIPLNL